MLEWPNYRKQVLEPEGWRYDSPGTYVRTGENGEEEEFHPHDFDPDARMPRWRALAEQGLAPGEPPAGGIVVLERSYEPLEATVEAACPFCGVVQQVAAWKRGVAQTGQKCAGCNSFVAAGCWEAA